MNVLSQAKTAAPLEAEDTPAPAAPARRPRRALLLGGATAVSLALIGGLLAINLSAGSGVPPEEALQALRLQPPAARGAAGAPLVSSLAPLSVAKVLASPRGLWLGGAMREELKPPFSDARAVSDERGELHSEELVRALSRLRKGADSVAQAQATLGDLLVLDGDLSALDLWVVAGSAREAAARRSERPGPVRLAFAPPEPGAPLVSLNFDLEPRAPTATGLVRAQWSDKSVSCSVSVDGAVERLAPLSRAQSPQSLELALAAALKRVDWSLDIRRLSLEAPARTPLRELAALARLAYTQSVEGIARRGGLPLSISFTLTPN